MENLQPTFELAVNFVEQYSYHISCGIGMLAIGIMGLAVVSSTRTDNSEKTEMFFAGHTVNNPWREMYGRFMDTFIPHSSEN